MEPRTWSDHEGEVIARFLRCTAGKLAPSSKFYNAPLDQYVAAIVHRAEFLAVADELDGNRRMADAAPLLEVLTAQNSEQRTVSEQSKNWTDEQEQTFSEIMRAGRLERLPAIRLYKRCRSNAVKAVAIARACYGLSEEQIAAYDRNKAARLAGLVKARQRRAQNRQIEHTKLAA